MGDDSFQFAPVAQIVAGLLILVLGRRLFWVFVGVVGFFFGLEFGAKFFDGLDSSVLLLLSLVVGAICAVLAVFLQRVAVAIAGGFAGGMFAFQLAPMLGLLTPGGQWVAFVAGALLAAVLVSVLFDPALVLLSAITGAWMIAGALPFDDLVQFLAAIALFIFGVVVQMRLGTGRRVPVD